MFEKYFGILVLGDFSITYSVWKQSIENVAGAAGACAEDDSAGSVGPSLKR